MLQFVTCGYFAYMQRYEHAHLLMIFKLGGAEAAGRICNQSPCTCALISGQPAAQVGRPLHPGPLSVPDVVGLELLPEVRCQS